MAKKAVSYKIDEETVINFNKASREQALNKSKWIENKMKEYLKEVRK